MKLSRGTALYVTLAAGVLSAGAALIAALVSVNELTELVRREERAVTILMQADSVGGALDAAETWQRFYLAETSEAARAAFELRGTELRQELGQMREALGDIGQRRRLAELRDATDALLSLLAQSMAVRTAYGADAALDTLRVGNVDSVSGRVRALLREFVVEERAILDTHRASSTRARQIGEGLLLWGGMLGLALLAAASLLLVRFQKARDQAIAGLSAAERRLDLALEGSALAVWDWDIPSDRVYLSPAWRQMLGDAPRETTTTSVALLELVPADEVDGVREALRAAVHSGSPYEVEHRVRCADGRFRWIASRGRVAETDVQQRPLRMAGTNRDITERKRFEHMQDEFVSTVSHELRTPLTSIRASLALLEQGQAGSLGADARRMVGIAYANCERLVRLVNDILDFQKSRSDAEPLDLAEHGIDTLIGQAVSALGALGAERGVALAAPAPDTGTRVRADADAVVRVLTNLIANALRHSPAGARVEVVAARAGARVRVCVVDHGEGVPEAFRDRLFQPFAQAEPGTGGRRQGSGLGLSITRALIERMGGAAGFEPTPGGGATFWFELPGAG